MFEAEGRTSRQNRSGELDADATLHGTSVAWLFQAESLGSMSDKLDIWKDGPSAHREPSVYALAQCLMHWVVHLRRLR